MGQCRRATNTGRAGTLPTRIVGAGPTPYRSRCLLLFCRQPQVENRAGGGGRGFNSSSLTSVRRQPERQPWARSACCPAGRGAGIQSGVVISLSIRPSPCEEPATLVSLLQSLWAGTAGRHGPTERGPPRLARGPPRNLDRRSLCTHVPAPHCTPALHAHRDDLAVPANYRPHGLRTSSKAPGPRTCSIAAGARARLASPGTRRLHSEKQVPPS